MSAHVLVHLRMAQTVMDDMIARLGVDPDQSKITVKVVGDHSETLTIGEVQDGIAECLAGKQAFRAVSFDWVPA